MRKLRNTIVTATVAAVLIGGLADGAAAEIEPMDNPIAPYGVADVEPFDNPIGRNRIEPMDNPIGR